MTTIEHASPVRTDSSPDSAARGPWVGVLATAAVTTIASATLMMVLGRFLGPSLVVLDILMLVGLILLRQHLRVGIAVIALGSLANLGLHGPIVVVQLSIVEAPASFICGLGLGLSSLLALVTSIPAWRGMPGSPRLPVLVRGGIVAIVVLALAVTTVLFATRTSDPIVSGDVSLTSTGLHVAPQMVTAPSGQITIAFRNDDPLFPRSLDIDALNVHLLVPPQTLRRVTFTATPGTYPFYDMATSTPATSGTLTVSPSH